MSSLELLKSLCDNFNPDEFGEFQDLLLFSISIFPGLDREIAKIYDIELDTVLLWIDGTIVPDKSTQSVISIFIRNKIEDYKEFSKEIAIPTTDLMTYNSWIPAGYVPPKVLFFQPWIIKARSIFNSFKVLFYTNDVTLSNLDNMLSEAKRDREALFHAKLTRKIAKCNKKVVNAIRDNNPSIAFRVGKKTVENVRLANAVKEYLKGAGFSKVEIMFEYLTTREGDVFVEINMQ